MNRTITLTGADAETVQRAVSEARDKCPELAGLSDSEVLIILVNAVLPETEAQA